MITEQKKSKTEYFIDWIFLNTSMEQIMNQNSVSKEIYRILLAISNSESFEIALHLISYAEV